MDAITDLAYEILIIQQKMREILWQPANPSPDLLFYDEPHRRISRQIIEKSASAELWQNCHLKKAILAHK